MIPSRLVIVRYRVVIYDNSFEDSWEPWRLGDWGDVGFINVGFVGTLIVECMRKFFDVLVKNDWVGDFSGPFRVFVIYESVN